MSSKRPSCPKLSYAFLCLVGLLDCVRSRTYRRVLRLLCPQSRFSAPSSTFADLCETAVTRLSKKINNNWSHRWHCMFPSVRCVVRFLLVACQATQLQTASHNRNPIWQTPNWEYLITQVVDGIELKWQQLQTFSHVWANCANISAKMIKSLSYLQAETSLLSDNDRHLGFRTSGTNLQHWLTSNVNAVKCWTRQT